MAAPVDALTPNTAAFLDSLTMDIKSSNPGFPPSAFFPVPGRDTPEESSPSSVGDPKAKVMVSDDSDQEAPTVNHKRKAHDEVPDHADEEDDDDSGSEAGHEDKRQHNNEPKKAGRKAANKGGEKGKDNMTKAQRRKEQNRAAQKAFRERREAKVRDLEQKVAELEAKSFGASVENENLRGILRRLQEENMALKQANFTFSMPPPNGVTAASGQQTPVANNGSVASGIDWSSFNSFKPQTQVPKPPSPPQSVNDTLRSINDPSPVHRSSIGSDHTPDSLVSMNGQSPSSTSERSAMPTLFGGMQSTAPTPILQNGSNQVNSSPSDTLSPPSSMSATNKEDVEALFRSLYPNGIDAVLANAANATSYTSSGLNVPGLTAPTAPAPQPLPSTPKFQTPYTFIGSHSGLTSVADSTSNALAKLFESTAYREPTTDSMNPNASTGLSGFAPSYAQQNSSASQMNTSLASQAPWSNITDNSVNEFLASLSGANVNEADVSGAVEDDLFSRQIEALISAQGGTMSPTSAFNLPNSSFSPTNYLNMSPSPMRSLSNSATPQSTAGTSVTSPQTEGSPAGAQQESLCNGSKVIHVLGNDGRVMRPSEVWTKMGMHNTAEPGDLLIDDLCDQMKAKATCKDGKRYMSYQDVEHVVKSREKSGTSRFGSRDASQPLQPTHEDGPLQGVEDCKTKKYHDPAECQARLNAAYVQANGGGF